MNSRCNSSLLLLCAVAVAVCIVLSILPTAVLLLLSSVAVWAVVSALLAVGLLLLSSCEAPSSSCTHLSTSSLNSWSNASFSDGTPSLRYVVVC